MIETANGAPSRLESQWRTSMRLKFGSITSPNDASTPLFRRKVSASETSPPILPAFQMSNLKSLHFDRVLAPSLLIRDSGIPRSMLMLSVRNPPTSLVVVTSPQSEISDDIYVV